MRAFGNVQPQRESPATNSLLLTGEPTRVVRLNCLPVTEVDLAKAVGVVKVVEEQ